MKRAENDLLLLIKFGKDKISNYKIKENPSKAIIINIPEGEELNAHTSPEEAFLAVLQGEGTYQEEGKDHQIFTGSLIHIRPEIFHSIKARTTFTFLLIR